MSRGPFDGKAVITGAGKSQVGRRLGRTGLELTVEAVLRAIADAGLDPDDIDGVASYPGPGVPDPGFSGATVAELRNALGLRCRWYVSSLETAGQIGPVIEACMAVTLGLANHVVAFRSVWESTAAQKAGGGRASVLFAGGKLPAHLEFMAPFGALSAANWLAMPAQRYMHDYGLTREQLGWIAINARRNAGLNPDAIYRDPMTMDDYLGARMISEPLCLYDCDIPCDGATAVIVSRRDAATGSRRRPLTVESVGPAMFERATWDQRSDIGTMAAHDSAASLWQNTILTPADVDMAQLYDGFSLLTVMWLEALGFCERGKAGEFIDGGENIGLTGSLPINTSGGQLSAGRLHGMGFLHEACIQLWGDGGDHQLPKVPEVVAIGVGGRTGCRVDVIEFTVASGGLMDLRVGVIGVGWGSHVQVPGFRAADGFEPVALCARTPDRLERVARKLGIDDTSTDWESFVTRDDLDVISVATPTLLHHDMALAALDAGKAVLCEKPLASELDAAQNMVRAAAKAGRPTACCFENRWNPEWLRIADSVRSGFLGKVYVARVSRDASYWHHSHPPQACWMYDRQQGGGYLAGMLVHDLDFLCSLLGRPQEVCADVRASGPVRHLPDGEVIDVTADDTAALLLRMESGVLAVLSVSVMGVHSDHYRLELFGADGTIVGDGSLRSAEYWIGGNPQRRCPVRPMLFRTRRRVGLGGDQHTGNHRR